MPSYKVAHIRKDGIDLIIVPMDKSFGFVSKESKEAVIAELQIRSAGAGLAGTVVPVWDNGGGRMGFIAHPNLHNYFRSISLSFVAANINRSLSW